jgi:hypothetical protein
MRKILFLFLILSAVGMGGEHAKTSSPTNKPDEKKERKEGEGLSDKTSDVLGSATDLEQNLDNPDFKKKIEVLSPEEKAELKAEVEKRQLETADNEQKKRFQLVLELLDQKEKEETQPSTSSSKPAGTPLQMTGEKIMGKNGKVDVYKLPGGFEVHLDPQGRKTIDGQALVVVGKEGATVMDGVFPANAFGLQVGDKGAISIDPKPSTLTVSAGNGPKTNSAVPVIFNEKGDAFARQGVIDEKGNQTLYWSNGSDFFKSAGKDGGDIVTVSRKELPEALEPKGTGNGLYLTVRATAESAPVEKKIKLWDPDFSLPNVSTVSAPAKQDPAAGVSQTLEQYAKTRESFAPVKATPEALQTEGGITTGNSPQQALTTQAVSSGGCLNGQCENPFSRPASRPGQCRKGMPCYRGP